MGMDFYLRESEPLNLESKAFFWASATRMLKSVNAEYQRQRAKN